jgi:hypothetical protein
VNQQKRKANQPMIAHSKEKISLKTSLKTALAQCKKMSKSNQIRALLN